MLAREEKGSMISSGFPNRCLEEVLDIIVG